MPQIILNERKAHLASYTLFTRDVDQDKDMSLSQLYQPPRALFFTEHVSLAPFFLWILQSFSEQLFSKPPETVVCRCSSKQVLLKVLQTSQESTRFGVSFQKKLLAQDLELYITAKKASTQVFSCEVYEISKNTFFIEYLW